MKKHPAKKTRRAEVDRGTWICSGDDRRPLYPMLAGIERREPIRYGQFRFNEDLCGMYAEAPVLRFRKACVEAWNAGQRWVTPHGQPPEFSGYTPDDMEQLPG